MITPQDAATQRATKREEEYQTLVKKIDHHLTTWEPEHNKWSFYASDSPSYDRIAKEYGQVGWNVERSVTGSGSIYWIFSATPTVVNGPYR